MGIEATETIKVVWQWGDNNYHRGLTMIDLTNKKGLVYLTNSQNGLSIATEMKDIFFITMCPLSSGWNTHPTTTVSIN